MIDKNSYANFVKAHEKSISLGGALTLFPVQPGLTEDFARIIQTAIENAEAAAFDRVVGATQKAMRRALVLKQNY